MEALASELHLATSRSSLDNLVVGLRKVVNACNSHEQWAAGCHTGFEGNSSQSGFGHGAIRVFERFVPCPCSYAFITGNVIPWLHLSSFLA